jgi:hypothetical protein
MNDKTREAIRKHGLQLLAIFPNATEQEPLELCRRLRRLEGEAARHALRGCNGPEWESEDNQYAEAARIIGKVNKLLGNVPEYQPKTGAACGCKRGQQRDNCPACEGTGRVIDFAAIRRAASALVPVFLNDDARGYSLKIRDEWMREHKAELHRDWGGYGILAPEIKE